MFGHHDDKKDDDKHQDQPVEAEQAAPQLDEPNEVVHPAASEPEAPAPETPAATEEEPPATAAESAADLKEPASEPTDQADSFNAGAAPDSEGQPWQHPGTPLNDDDADDDQEDDTVQEDESPEPISDVIYPAGLPKPPSFRHGGDPAPQADNDDPAVHQLLDIKVKALDELVPLIDDLDMPADEKFRTVMMMIQASDNQELVPKAYETAHAIEDEKTRAQALLDIVNEINYFTQPHTDQPEA